MPLLVIPNTWSPTDVPAAADMNENFQAVVDSANGIQNAQIAVDADIDGTKVAELATANYEDASFPGSKLVPGAATFGQFIGDASAQSEAVTGVENLVVSRSQVRSGGGLLILGTVWVQVDGSGALDTVRLRLLEDASPIATDQSGSTFFDASWEQGIQLSVMEVLSPAVTASKTWALGVTRTGGATTMVCTGWQLLLWELR